jgi:hypothetical protein
MNGELRPRQFPPGFSHGPLSEAPASPPKAPGFTVGLPMALRANRSPGRAPRTRDRSGRGCSGSPPPSPDAVRRARAGVRPDDDGRRRWKIRACVRGGALQDLRETKSPSYLKATTDHVADQTSPNIIGSIVVHVCKEDGEAEQVGRLVARGAGPSR